MYAGGRGGSQIVRGHQRGAVINPLESVPLPLLERVNADLDASLQQQDVNRADMIEHWQSLEIR